MLPLTLLLSVAPPEGAPTHRNAHALVLVGGFTVWGREEALGLRYWGGPGRDIQADLSAQGHRVVTAAVGPLSSNWDRACELFAILKGGRVDYGAAHAAAHGHARFGRMHAGLLPDWGTADASGKVRKAHFVGHSQGGQTIRVLSQLLAEGAEAERRAAVDASPLFAGGKAWVASLTTLATPHDGTTLVWKREHLLGPAQRFLAWTAQLRAPGAALYDLKLDHWKLPKGEDTSEAVFRRLERAPLATTRDFAPYDLGTEGAAELNAWVKAQPGVHHFSWSTAKTMPDAEGHQVPMPHMTLPWRRSAAFMGKTLALNGHGPLDARWLRNDGVVNTCSMAGPSTDPIQAFSGTPCPGTWNHMGVLEGWDHTEVIGFGPQHQEQLLPFYRSWADFLAALEAD